MPRIAIILGALLEAVLNGVSCLAGEDQLGFLASTVLSIASLVLMTVITIAADALELPDVMSID
jgi:hypothetical protein